MKREFADVILAHAEKFKAIYRLGSQSRAASYLGIHQSTLSYSLKQIEDAFGSDIFLRVGNTLKPTADAHKVMDFLRKVDEVKSSFLSVEEFSQFKLAQKMRVSVGGDGYFSSFLLPEICNVLYEELENSGMIFEHVYMHDKRQAIEALLYNEIDLFVASSVDNEESLSASNIKKQLLLNDSWVFAVSRTTAQIRGTQLSAFDGAPLALPKKLLRSAPETISRLSVFDDIGLVCASPHRADHVLIVPEKIMQLDYMQLTKIDNLFSVPSKISVHQYWNVEKTKDKGHAWLRSKIKTVCSCL